MGLYLVGGNNLTTFPFASSTQYQNPCVILLLISVIARKHVDNPMVQYVLPYLPVNNEQNTAI